METSFCFTFYPWLSKGVVYGQAQGHHDVQVPKPPLASHPEYELIILLPMDVRRSQHSSKPSKIVGHGYRGHCAHCALERNKIRQGKVFSGLLRESWQKAKEVSDADASPSWPRDRARPCVLLLHDTPPCLGKAV